jgi:hypothetical protein
MLGGPAQLLIAQNNIISFNAIIIEKKKQTREKFSLLVAKLV